MKILFIQKEGGIFGAEQFHLKTIPALKKAGIELHFLRLYTNYQLGINSPFVTELENFGVPVYQVNIGRFPGWSDIKAIKEIIENENYSVIHTHLIHADLYGAILKRFILKKMVLVSTKHGYEESYNNQFGFDSTYTKRNLYYRLCKFSDSVVNKSYAISDGLKNFFVNSGISNPNTIARIHYGFDMQWLKPNPNPKGYRKAPKQLVLVGRLVGFKGHRFALRALALLIHKHPTVKLVIIGIGELEKDLRELARELDIESAIEFLGYKNDVTNYMYHSDVVLIPSIAEGFGVVFLEAINQGKPIAAFDVSAGNEILKGAYTNLLVQPFNVQEYANLIDAMLIRPNEMEQPIKLAKERMLSYFTINRMVDEMQQFYKEALKEKNI